MTSTGNPPYLSRPAVADLLGIAPQTVTLYAKSDATFPAVRVCPSCGTAGVRRRGDVTRWQSLREKAGRLAHRRPADAGEISTGLLMAVGVGGTFVATLTSALVIIRNGR